MSERRHVLVNCAHAPAVTGRAEHGVTCAIGLCGGQPSPGRCKRCDQRVPRDPSKPAVEYVQITVKVESYDGSHEWAALYALAQTASPDAFAAHLDGLSQRLPVFGCSCRRDFDAYRAQHPPAGNLFAWVAALHNHVNRKLKRDEWTLEQARERWG